MKAAIKFFLFYYLLLIFSTVSAEAVVSAETVGEIPAFRAVPKENLNKYLEDSAFDYDRAYQNPVTFWDMVKYWFQKFFFQPILENVPVTFWEILQYVLTAIAAGVVIYYLSKGGKGGLFARNNPLNKIQINDGVGDIHLVNFDALVEEAVTEGHYRLAVRYLYLKSLKGLSEKNMISWKSEKTNHDYLKELRTSAIRPMFSEITYWFDYSWYGNSGLNESGYANIKGSFEKFDKALITGK
ncbi:MAG: hypothetical protein H0X62_16375 [Bacteroidetes bacterium]|nr:hypothetical protein [Bacteroidota bacterium]